MYGTQSFGRGNSVVRGLFFFLGLEARRNQIRRTIFFAYKNVDDESLVFDGGLLGQRLNFQLEAKLIVPVLFLFLDGTSERVHAAAARPRTNGRPRLSGPRTARA